METSYERPNLTRDEKWILSITAKKINQLADPNKRGTYIVALLIENARLTKEINDHRKNLGIDPLPTFDPNKADI